MNVGTFNPTVLKLDFYLTNILNPIDPLDQINYIK